MREHGLEVHGLPEGAAHQAPQEFQVVTDRRLPMIRVGRARIRFVKKARAATTPTVRVNTPTGQMRVSIPEATAIDLVRYPEPAGFLSNVATVLRELVERIDRRGLLRVATADGETAYAQRLGYLLDLVGRSTVAEPLAEWIAARAPRVTPLTPGLPITGMPRNLRWRVAVNDQVEADEGMA